MIQVRVVGVEQTLLSLRAFGLGVRERLRVAVTRAAIELTRYVKEEKLSGQVLKNRTGTLRRKVNYRVQETASDITGSVGVQSAYGRVHELGFDGTVTVKEHLRTITQAFGRSIAPTTFTMPAHQRHMKLPERSYLRSSLRELGPSIREQLAMAVTGAPRG
jgi:hypothetical protein